MYKLLITLLVSSAAFSATITDNAGFFNHFEKLTSTKKFVDSHPCNFEAVFNETVDSYEIFCQDGWCGSSIESTEQDYKMTIQSCTPTQVNLLEENGDLIVFTEKEFTNLKGNYVRKYLENFESIVGYEFDIEIDSFKTTAMTIGHTTNNQRKEQVLNITGRLNFKNFPHEEEFIMSVSPDRPAIMQILRMRMSNHNWFRFMDFKL